MGSLFTVESWTLHALGVGLIVARLISRLSTLGSIRRLQLDDWTMILAVVPFTGMVLSANQSFYPSRGTARRLKMRFLLEEFQVTTAWLIKACLLILYRRISPATRSSSKRKMLFYISVYCFLSYALVQVLLALWCDPVRDYWDPSAGNTQCQTYRNHSILVLALDTTTILATFVPIAFIPTPRKLLQASLVLLGTCILTSSILSRYYVLVHSQSSKYIHWYITEATLMILFANLPFLSSLFAAMARSRGRSTALISWPRSYTEDMSVVEQAPRKGSAAIGGSMDLAMGRKETWDSTSPTFLSELRHDEVVAAVPPVLVRRPSIRDSIEDFASRGKVMRPSSASLRPPPL